MKLLINPTSPYARIARIVLAEKGVEGVETQFVDPWGDTPALLAANPAARVPTLLLDDGRVLTESLLIVQWLEHERPDPALIGPDPVATLARAGTAMGVIDAAVHTLIGRKITDAGFDASPVGLRRQRTMARGLQALEADPPTALRGRVKTLDAIAAVVALDYLDFRFPEAPWQPDVPALRRLAAELAPRESFVASRPRNPP